MFEYYDRRAPEYDEWYLGTGRFADEQRPGWLTDLRELCEAIEQLAPMKTLDVACGTGFLTRFLHGPVTALDQSAAMIAVARERLPDAELVQAEAIPLPFPDASFDRVFTGHFYGHLGAGERAGFLSEASRVARELVVVDSHERPDRGIEEEQERVLNDGSVHHVYKRYFTGAGLAEELGGGDVLHDGRWFVMVRAPANRAAPAAV
jgi:ubiquinone/menaquinone biosynthesis C-methylase UbiE